LEAADLHRAVVFKLSLTLTHYSNPLQTTTPSKTQSNQM